MSRSEKFLDESLRMRHCSGVSKGGGGGVVAPWVQQARRRKTSITKMYYD